MDIRGLKFKYTRKAKPVIFDNGIISQYIGKNDKGKEIYEGDYDSDGIIAVWCDRCKAFQFGQIDLQTKETVIKCHNCEGNFMFLDHFHDFMEIGNLILDWHEKTTPENK